MGDGNAVSAMFFNMLEISAVCGVGVLLVLGISPLLKKRHTVFWRYVLWILLAIRLVFPFDISISEKAYVFSLPESLPTSRQEHFFSDEKERESGVSGISEKADEDFSNVEIAVQSDKLSEQDETKEQSIASSNPEKSERKPDSFANTVSPNPAEIWTELFIRILPLFWAAGALAFLAWQVTGYAMLRNKVKKTKVFLIEKENIPVYLTKAVCSPMLMGIIAPQILLPDRTYDDGQLQFILDHEIAHLKRKDLWIKLLFALARTIHWFNPFVALLERRAVLDMEFLCDIYVVKDFTKEEKKKYGEALLDCAAAKNGAAFLCTGEFSRDAKTLKERFANIFSEQKRKKGVLAAFFGAGIVLSVSLFFAFGPSKEEHPEAGEEAVHTESANKAEQTAHKTREREALLKEKRKKLLGLSLEEAANSIYGAVFPKLIYVSEKRAILYDYWGLLIYNITDRKIHQILDLRAADLGYIQGEKTTHIEVSGDGEQILLYNEPDGKEKFIYYVRNQRLEYTDLTSFEENHYDGLIEREEINYARTENEKLAYLSRDSLITEDGDVFHEADMLGLSLIVLQEDEGDARIYPLFSEVYEKNGKQVMTRLKRDNLRIVVGKKYLHEDKEGWTYYLEEDEMKESPLQELGGVVKPLLLTRYQKGERQILENLTYQEAWFDCPVIFTEGRIVYKAARAADTMGIKDPALVSIAMDGSDRQTADDIMYHVYDGICEDGGWIYYSGWTNDGTYPKPLCRIAPDFSGGPMMLEEIPGLLCGVHNGVVYYLASREQAVRETDGIWKRNLATGEEKIYDKWGICAEDITVLNVREKEDLMDILDESEESPNRSLPGFQMLFYFDYEGEIHSSLLMFDERY